MLNYLKISYYDSQDENIKQHVKYENRVLPFNHTDIFEYSIYDYELLAEETRRVYNLKISSKDIKFNYEAGFTIGVLPSNDAQLVNQLMVRLGLERTCDKVYELKIHEDTKKKNACIPKHIPVCNTVRDTFLHHIDIHAVPKKLFLKNLLHFIEDQEELKELEFMCSPKGSEAYNKLISSYTDRSLISILNRFSSCHPPVETLFEYLPPLLPRPYSISSSPLIKDYLSFTFSVDTFENNKGLCTSWLEKCIQDFEDTRSTTIPLYLRTPSDFKLPEDNYLPIIMIATGTGIAPFRGFLEHRHLQILEGVAFGPSHLFYGCRTSRDYLFKKDFQDYLTSRALSEIQVSFSRESEKKCYVQHKIEENWAQLNSLITGSEARIYACGDYSKVLPAVRNSFVKVLILGGFTSESAELYLDKMIKEHRYIEDSWK